MFSTVSSVQLIKIDHSSEGQKLISFLKQKTKIPYSGLMRLLRTGQIRVNGKRCSAFYKLKVEDKIRIPPFKIDPNQSYYNKALPFQLISLCKIKETKQTLSKNVIPIIYEDNEILLVSKPSGLAVHKGSKTLFSLMDIISVKYQDNTFIPTPVHRLDKQTSGLLLLAKTFSKLRLLQQNWSNITKKYLVKVQGKWPYNREKKITHYLYKPKKGIIQNNPQKGKKSVCIIKPIIITEKQSFLEVSLLTGRTRQIRAQLALEGYPIIGDNKFACFPKKIPLYLHAFYLSIKGKQFIDWPQWAHNHLKTLQCL